MKTIDTAHRLNAPETHLELPAPEVQKLLVEWKRSIAEILDTFEPDIETQRLLEAEQNFRDLAAMFGKSKEEIAEMTKRDRVHNLGNSVFYRVQTKAANDERYAKAA